MEPKLIKRVEAFDFDDTLARTKSKIGVRLENATVDLRCFLENNGGSETTSLSLIVSNKKNRFTSSAGINLGAIVTNTNGIATHIMHISGTMNKSRSFKT